MTEEQFLRAEQLRAEIKRLEQHGDSIKDFADSQKEGLGWEVSVFSKFIDWQHYDLMLSETLTKKKAELEDL